MKSNAVSFGAGLILGALFLANLQNVQGQKSPSTNQVTILEDFTPLPGQMFGSVSIQPQKNGQLVGNVIPRWVIPGRVTPKIYGDILGAAYFYFNQSTQQRESGIFTPSNPPGPQIPPEVWAQMEKQVPLSCTDGSKKWAPRASGRCFPEDAPK